MKKILFLLLSVTVAALITIPVVNAQTINAYMPQTDNYCAFTGIVAADTIAGTAEKGKTFFVGRKKAYDYLYIASADSLNADSTALFILKGSHNGLKFFPIDTAVWGITKADTTVYFSSGGTKVLWRFLQVSVKGNKTGTTKKAKLGNQYLIIGE
jgi:hypothetical protein